MNKKEIPPKIVKPQMTGEVVGKSAKTVRVLVLQSKFNSLYRKHYQKKRYFLAHDEENKLKKGDKAGLFPARPISKLKHYYARPL
ncbi:mitochondrial small ribosomal subunit protein uS17m [Candidatus Berkelbacteria bacterium]|nr:mitochondrial small ribosomal subunit protein uS17m [Candidatus Berkelbacteria bacterium]MBI4029745.1 mitochondrial small ribosomal subunit protein uS17m [Candidatus Berkelbacteria bacterium]